MKKTAKKSLSLSFKSKLESISSEMEYYALSIPLKVTQTLKTKGPVPVLATVNNSESFMASLFPVGGGRHYLRVRNKICKSVHIKANDQVSVKITVRDREDEVAIPKDLLKALRDEGVVEDFKSISIGKRSYLLRLIEQAAKPETRQKRINDALEAANQKRIKK